MNKKQARKVVLGQYVRVASPVDHEVALALRTAATQGKKLIEREASAGNTLRAASLSTVVAELKRQQQVLWGSVSRSVDRGVAATSAAAVQAQKGLDMEVRRTSSRAEQRELYAALEELTRQRIALYRYAGLGSTPATPLSSKVYKARDISSGRIERLVRSGILLGRSADEIALDVEKYIKPTVPGGVSYAARRFAVTEIQNAYHIAQIVTMMNDPAVVAVNWNLAQDHPENDICDVYEANSPYSYELVPGKPHPFCLCFLTQVEASEEVYQRKLADLLDSRNPAAAAV